MTSKVYWRHKGHPDKWHIVEFDGPHIGILDVKRDILRSRMSSLPSIQKLWNEAFDYALFHDFSQQAMEFGDEKGTIPKNTHLVVYRVADPGHYLIRRVVRNEPRQVMRSVPTTLRAVGHSSTNRKH